METNLHYCTFTGRTISEKTMEDGNILNTKDDKTASASLANLYSERPGKLTANGHDFAGECSGFSDETYTQYRPIVNTLQDDKSKKRINPLRIHLGKRPFVDNTVQYSSANKKRKLLVNKSCESSALPRHSTPVAPKLIPKRLNRNVFHNVASQAENAVDDEKNKPVPRLVPKNMVTQFKKNKIEKGAQLKEYAQNLGLQPMVKFKCRKCCSMSFKTLAMLKEHQLVCRVQPKEPALSPVAAPPVETAGNGGPSRVTRKVYLCSACGTYYENWNLFLHMREIHNRHICLFCLGMFSKAEKLSSHLANKHNVLECNYESKEEFFSVYNGTMYLMCCLCDEICTEQDDFFNHDCNKVIPRPVPVLVNKNTAKPNSIKLVRNGNEFSINGPSTKEFKSACDVKNDKKDTSELKSETITSQSKVTMELSSCTTISSDTSISSENTVSVSKDSSNTTDLGIDLDSLQSKQILRQESPAEQTVSPERSKLPNGDDLNNSDRSETPDSDSNQALVIEDHPSKPEEPPYLPVEKEKECGIKLKLSLNNANSPVIINSTVDPTIGQQNVHKPPSRVRRPPKRYEKDLPKEPVVQPKTPTIKMTICDKADSPFVKTTIYDNDKETTLKTLLNNNLECTPKTSEPKLENIVKTTIYDNNLDDMNILNRVPKLTVRVPKELLDKDSSSDYSSDSDISDKLTVDENNTNLDNVNEIKEENKHEPQPEPHTLLQEEEVKQAISPTPVEEKIQIDDSMDPKLEPQTDMTEKDTSVKVKSEELAVTDEVPVTELTLDKPLDKYPLKDLLKVFLTSTVYNCSYCNHVRKIAVNCENLSLHMVAQHRFAATVDSITAEELMPETITAKVKQGAEELRDVYMNVDSYDSIDKHENLQYDHIFECFQCYFKTAVHKDLYLHNRKMHQKTIMLCIMCKTNFYSYSELLCHLCPGTYDSEYDIKFRCCLCSVDSIPSSFRLMVHLRKIHHTCDVCLEFCYNQSRLSNHVWKHKLHHICYRCGIAYRNKPDITKHLFWKHGTESVMCKKCLQKKWPHVYHFCVPPAIFVCDECSAQFTKAVYLKVHKRFHAEEYPHLCTEEGCVEKFVSKKLLAKHIEEHRKKLVTEDLNEKKQPLEQVPTESVKEPIPVIDLVNDEKPKEEIKTEEKPVPGTEQLSKKGKKKKSKDRDALLLDVNLPALNLSESDSSDESDGGVPLPGKTENSDLTQKSPEHKPHVNESNKDSTDAPVSNVEEKSEIVEEEKPDEKQVLEIWDNFKKYQADVEKQKEKTPPLVPIRKHVCESDHDYCLIPTDINGDEDRFHRDKKKNKKSPKKRHGDLSSSSSSSSDSDSSCSCGSNCSCSSSSGSSSSSSSDSDSSDESGNEKKKNKQAKKALANRRMSNGSNVDVMGMSETPILIPEKNEPTIAETDLETDESETDEEFYDKCPQHLANKLTEKRNLMLLASVAPSDGGSVSGEASRCTTPIKEEKESKDNDIKEKPPSSKKKSKKKKKSKGSKKHAPIKINIPKDIIAKSEVDITPPPNKITISLQTNTVQIPEAPKPTTVTTVINASTAMSIEKKRASKRRRVPNKFYGYSSEEEATSTTTAFKPQQPPKLEWRKEDLPSPVTHKTKKEVPSSTISHRLYNYTEPIRLKAPIPDPEPPRFLMNSESMDESSDSDSSEEKALEIDQPNTTQNTLSAPTYLNSGTSSLPYPFQRPAVRQAREGESVYCYCRCPYDEVSEMIACDAEGCPIEWFHFECVGIMVPPKGKWYCPECRKNQNFSGYR